MGVIRVIFYLFLITSLPDTAGGEGNPTVKRHHVLFSSLRHLYHAEKLGAVEVWLL